MPKVGDMVTLPAWCEPTGPLRVLRIEEPMAGLLQLSGYTIGPDLAQTQGNWRVPAEQLRPASDPAWPEEVGAALPPQGSIVTLARGRFLAVIVRRASARRLFLRGWFLDRDTQQEESLTVASADIVGWEKP